MSKTNDPSSMYYVAKQVEYKGFILKCEPNHGDGSFGRPWNIYGPEGRAATAVHPHAVATEELAKRFVDAHLQRVAKIVERMTWE